MANAQNAKAERTLKESFIQALVITLITVRIANAWMIESEITPHQGTRETEVVINYQLNETITGTPRLKIYLNLYDPTINGFDYNIHDTLMDYFEVNPSNTTPIKLKLTDKKSWFYRICLRMEYEGNYYRDCDAGNQFLLLDDTPINLQLLQEEISDLILEAQTPENAVINEEAIINATLTNYGSEKQVTLYSYIHNGSQKISQDAWDANAQTITLAGGAVTQTTLKNTATTIGNFTITIRARTDKDIDIKKTISIQEPESVNLLINDIKIIDNKVRVIASNYGSINETITLTIYLIDSITQKNITLNTKRAYQELISTQLSNGTAIITLTKNDKIILQKEQEFNKTIKEEIKSINQEAIPAIQQEEVIHEEKKETINTNNETTLLTPETSINSMQQETNQTINTESITGMITAIPKENLLYTIIVLVSITALGAMIKKI